MPSKNSRKVFVTDSFYHVYNRGVEKRAIFLNEEDYGYFLYLLKRHLSKLEYKDANGRPYKKFGYNIDLLSFCLMPNHFHLLLYLQDDENAISKLMTTICTAYTMYFNKKYQRVGHLFQDRYKASHILSDSYLQHISRYIHLNPKDYREYRWSSFPYYVGSLNADWIKPELVMSMFNDADDYIKFVQDYESHKSMLDELKHSLANY